MARRLVHHLRSKPSLIGLARILWLLVVLWWELGTFYWRVAWCRWPKSPASSSVISGEASAAHRVLLIADPQVPRPYKGWIPGPGWFKQYIVNHNLRKSWSAARRVGPETIVFLGDMLSAGSKCKTDKEYAEYFNKFKRIFKTDAKTMVYYVPGNRDVGLGPSRKFSKDIRTRYESYFGSPNQLIPDRKNHTLVLLDAPALVEEDYRRHGEGYKFRDWQSVSGGSIDFIKTITDTRDDLPIILFTHIPLWRPEGASCGPLREYGNIRRGVGKGYQSLLGKETSRFLLDYVRPSIIFSADDLDYCEHLHLVSLPAEPNTQTLIPEITVKSFSMATKLQNPGFQMLSLFPASSPSPSNASLETTTPLIPPSHAHSLCLLPNQLTIYTQGYIPLILLTILFLISLNVRRFGSRPPHLNGSGTGAHGLNHFAFPSGPESVSPGRRSPPISPIHYKTSRSRNSGILRSATTMPGGGLGSQPNTPLGGTPFLSPSFPPPIEEDDTQELLIWQSQLDGPKASPMPTLPESSEVDSSYFLPNNDGRFNITSRKTTWTPGRPGLRFTPRNIPGLLMAIPVTLLGSGTWSMGPRRARTWYGRFGQDLAQVMLAPAVLYVLISVWLYL